MTEIAIGSLVRVRAPDGYIAAVRTKVDRGRVGTVQKIFTPLGRSDQLARVVFPPCHRGRRVEPLQPRQAHFVRERAMMKLPKDVPNIDAVRVTGPSTIAVDWNGRTSEINLAGWIGAGRELLAALTEPTVFARAQVGSYGGAVTWDDGEGDLSIDSVHLEMLAALQQPFTAADLVAWQATMKLSNQEAADLFDLALSTWNTYRAGANIPSVVRIACMMAETDPLVMNAYYRPRKVGRPKFTRGAKVYRCVDTDPTP